MEGYMDFDPDLLFDWQMMYAPLLPWLLKVFIADWEHVGISK
jgi:hypothetical protein